MTILLKFDFLVDDEDLKEQLRINMDKAKDFLENFKSINQEIKNYYANLDLKYDEYGRRSKEERDSVGNTAMGYLLEKLVNVRATFLKKDKDSPTKK